MSQVVLPASSGSELEDDALHLLAARLGGRCLGVVGDVPAWGPEAAVSLGVAASAAARSLGVCSDELGAVVAALGAVLVFGQVAGARLLDGLFPRSPSWAVAVDPDPVAEVVIAIPTDVPLPGLTPARVALGVLCLAVALLPPLSAVALGLPPLLLLWRRPPPDIAARFRGVSGPARAARAPIFLCGAACRDARGPLGVIDWVQRRRPAVIWVAGDGGGCVVLPRGWPSAWSAEARAWLADPAVLRLWLRGFEVRVVGGPGPARGLEGAVAAALIDRGPAPA